MIAFVILDARCFLHEKHTAGFSRCPCHVFQINSTELWNEDLPFVCLVSLSHAFVVVIDLGQTKSTWEFWDDLQSHNAHPFTREYSDIVICSTVPHAKGRTIVTRDGTPGLG